MGKYDTGRWAYEALDLATRTVGLLIGLTVLVRFGAWWNDRQDERRNARSGRLTADKASPYHVGMTPDALWGHMKASFRNAPFL